MNSEAEFLKHLAGEYLRFSLPDEALSVLAELPEDLSSDDKAVALSMIIHAQYQRQDLPKLLYLGETLPDEVTLLPHAAGMLASAYWTAGFKDKAHRLLQTASSYVPTLEELREMYVEKPETLVVDEPPPSLEEILALSIKARLGYHFVLENLIPLIWQCRAVTCCFSDQVRVLVEAGDNLHGEDLKKLYLSVAQMLKQVFGINTAFLVYFLPMGHKVFGEPRIKLYLGTNPELMDRVQELEELYWQTATPWEDNPSWQEIMLREATLLGYPECCGQAAASLRTQGGSLEKNAIMHFLRETVKSVHWPEVPAPNQAYYTFEFYPCSPRCSEAESRGRSLEECYRKNDGLMLKLYQTILLKFNLGPILWPWTPFRERMEGFDNHVESLLGDLGERLAQLRHEQEKEFEESERH